MIIGPRMGLNVKRRCSRRFEGFVNSCFAWLPVVGRFACLTVRRLGKVLTDRNCDDVSQLPLHLFHPNREIRVTSVLRAPSRVRCMGSFPCGKMGVGIVILGSAERAYAGVLPATATIESMWWPVGI